MAHRQSCKYHLPVATAPGRRTFFLAGFSPSLGAETGTRYVHLASVVLVVATSAPRDIPSQTNKLRYYSVTMLVLMYKGSQYPMVPLVCSTFIPFFFEVSGSVSASRASPKSYILAVPFLSMRMF